MRTWASLLVGVLVVASVATAGLYEDDAVVDRLNEPPTAKHPDRLVEDEDGDGEVTIRLTDRYSSDPDHVHDTVPQAYCVGSPLGDRWGIEGWDWFDATGLNDTEFELSPSTHLSRGNPSAELTFGLGEHKIALRVEDKCDAHGWTNFTLSIASDVVELEAFEDPIVDDAWTTTGLWHVEDRCGAEDAVGSYLAYNAYDLDPRTLDEDCDYDDREVEEGIARSGEIDLASGSDADWSQVSVRFDHRFEVGTSRLGDQDRMTFEVSFDGGQTWIGSQHTESGCGTEVDADGTNCWDDDSPTPYDWRLQENLFDPEDVNAAGDDFRLRWTFARGGAQDNDHLGWLVDDVRILGVPQEASTSG